jgi:hypothetical protein
LRLGQLWPIQKLIGLQFFKTSYLFQRRCLLKRKVNNSQQTEEHARFLYTIWRRHFFIFKMSYHLLCENYHDNNFFHWVTQVGIWLRSPAGVKGFSVGFSLAKFSEKYRAATRFPIFLKSTVSWRGWSYQIYELSICWGEHAVDSNVFLEYNKMFQWTNLEFIKWELDFSNINSKI